MVSGRLRPIIYLRQMQVVSFMLQLLVGSSVLLTGLPLHYFKVDWMLESIHSPRGSSMHGIHYQPIASNVNMFQIRIDKYLAKARYTLRIKGQVTIRIL